MKRFPVRALQNLRPFPNAHWSLLAVLLLAFGWPLLKPACSTGTGFWQRSYLHHASYSFSLLTALVFVSLWLADPRRGTVQGWQRAIRVGLAATADLARFAVLLFLTVTGVRPYMPVGDCTTAETRTFDALLMLSVPRVAVAERATVQGTLVGSGKGLFVPPIRPGDFGKVLSDGTIVWASEKPVATLVLTPVLEGGKVTWQCWGWPLEAMSFACRSLPTTAESSAADALPPARSVAP